VKIPLPARALPVLREYSWRRDRAL